MAKLLSPVVHTRRSRCLKQNYNTTGMLALHASEMCIPSGTEKFSRLSKISPRPKIKDTFIGLRTGLRTSIKHELTGADWFPWKQDWDRVQWAAMLDFFSTTWASSYFVSCFILIHRLNCFHGSLHRSKFFDLKICINTKEFFSEKCYVSCRYTPVRI